MTTNYVKRHSLLARATDEIFETLQTLAATTPQLMTVETIAEHFSAPLWLINDVFDAERPRADAEMKELLVQFGAKLLAKALEDAHSAKSLYERTLIEINRMHTDDIKKLLAIKEFGEISNRLTDIARRYVNRMHRLKLICIFHSAMMTKATAEALAESFIEE